jgi:hypothetical protein
MRIADVLAELTIQPLRRFAVAWDVSTIKSDKRDVFEQAILGEVSRIDTEEAVLQRVAAFEQEIDYVGRTNAEIVLRLILDEPGYAIADECQLIKAAVAAEAAFFEYARPTLPRGTSTSGPLTSISRFLRWLGRTRSASMSTNSLSAFVES